MKYIIFGNCSNNSDKKLMINDVEIKKVTQFLRVITGNKLCWKPHTNYIKVII